MRHPCLTLVFLSLITYHTSLFAQPLPPALAHLQSAITTAQAQLATTQAAQAHLAQTHHSHLTQLHQQLTTLLQLRRLPPTFVTAHSLTQPHTPPLGNLLTHAARNQFSQTQTLSTQLATYLRTTAAAQQQLAQLTALQATFTQGRHHLQALEKQALHQATLSAQALTAALAQPVATSTVSSLPTTARLPVLGRIIAGTHADGLTFSAPTGSPVSSVGAGTVVYSGPFQRFGGLVIVRAAGGHYLLYGQLGTLAVTTGQSVTTGQTLGKLANDTTQPAQLFFQVRRRGTPLNAQRYLTSLH